MGTNAVKWTSNQLNAIDARGSTLLVSAAAGSGKTAVLTNRIISKIINDKCEITDFLIVTFTRAAANEMKNKIVYALREKSAQNPADNHLRRQISRIGEAKISTIDSFCVSVIKDHFNLLGLPAKMRLMDEAESKVFLNRQVNQMLENFYARYDSEKNSSFNLVVEALSGDRDDEGLVKSICEIYKSMVSFPEPIKLLERINQRIKDQTQAFYSEKKGVFETFWGEILKNELKLLLHDAEGYMLEADGLCLSDDILEKNYRPAVESDLEFVRKLLDALGMSSYELLRKTLEDYTPQRLKSAAKSDCHEEIERIKSLRNALKNTISRIKEDIVVYPQETAFEQCEISCKMCQIIVDMLKELTLSMRKEKIQKNIMDFSDLSHFTFEAFVKPGTFDYQSGDFEKTQLAQKITEEFTEIFIDEYQDTNMLQDTLFKAISNGKNLFMVGDLKQSIYRFRGADPSIFRHYKDTFKSYYDVDSQQKKIFLSENFRSNGGVIDFVNALFSRTMNCLSPGSYVGEDMLICTKTEDKIIPQLHMFEKSPRGAGDSATEKEAEWEYIANRISEFVKSGYNYSDIAVLTRDSLGILQMKRILDKYNIPCVTESRESLFDKSEILIMLCILNTIDNPTRDIYLIGAMTSPFFGFTSDQLYKIRLLSDDKDKSCCFYDAVKNYLQNGEDKELVEKIQSFEQVFSHWRTVSTQLGVSQLIRTVFNDISALTLINDKAGAENLISFYDFAKSFESKDMKGLFSFISYVNDIIENGFSLNVPQESGNSVRLMTMHKSKGLEFPVCFVAGLNKMMNTRDLSSNMIFNKELGIVTRLCDYNGIISYDSLLKKVSALSEKNRMLEEEMRLLYVALTRAKQHLILTCSVSNSEIRPEGAVSTIYDINKAQSHFDLIASALKYDPSYRNLTMGGCVYCDQLKIKVFLHNCSADIESKIFSHKETQQKVINLYPGQLEFEYGYSQFSTVPQKLSVSQLHLGLSDDIAEQEQVLPYPAPFFINQNSKKNAAAVGTAMHTFVQFCDYEICAKKGCEYEAERLLREVFITREQYDMLDFEKLNKLFKSTLYQKISRSKNVRREMRFNILVDGEKINSCAKGEKILIQGVIDCFFENPDGSYTVVDFKTDHVHSEDILISRHHQQLDFYSYAVEDMTSQKVSEKIIYSFEMSREIYLP